MRYRPPRSTNAVWVISIGVFDGDCIKELMDGDKIITAAANFNLLLSTKHRDLDAGFDGSVFCASAFWFCKSLFCRKPKWQFALACPPAQIAKQVLTLTPLGLTCNQDGQFDVSIMFN